MKKDFNKELIITKEDDGNFKNSAKCSTCNNSFAEGDVKVRDHCHDPIKYRSASYRDCNFHYTRNSHCISQSKK